MTCICPHITPGALFQPTCPIHDDPNWGTPAQRLARMLTNAYVDCSGRWDGE